MTKEQAIQELLSHLEHWERLKTEHIAPVDEATSTIDALLMAIKALSEPSGDLISRADAIKAVWNAYADAINFGDSGEEIASDIDIILSALPSSEAVSREEVTAIKNNYINEISELLNKIDALSADAEWIPCSERLPEEFYVLCCDNHGEMIIANLFACDDSDTGFSAESEDCYMYNCVAWMPLPEPYREDGET